MKAVTFQFSAKFSEWPIERAIHPLQVHLYLGSYSIFSSFIIIAEFYILQSVSGICDSACAYVSELAKIPCLVCSWSTETNSCC